MVFTHKCSCNLTFLLSIIAMMYLGACEQQEQVPSSHTPISPGAMSELQATAQDVGAIRLERRGEQEARYGERYEYQIVVTNTSDNPVHNVIVREMLAEGMEIDESEPEFQIDQQQQEPQQQSQRGQQQQGQQRQAQQRQDERSPDQQQSQRPPRERSQQQQRSQPQSVSWHLGMLDSGQSQVIDVTAIPMAEGAFASCVTVSYDPAVCTSLYVTSPELELVTMTADAVYVCDDLPVQVQVRNAGSGTTPAGRLHLQLPQGLQSANNQRELVQELQPLEAGESRAYEFNIQANQPGNYNLRARAETGRGEVQSSQAQVEVVVAELQLDIRGPQQAYLGSRSTYEIVVTNPSDVIVYNTLVEVQPPQNVTRFNLSARGMQGDGESNRIEIGRLGANESRSVFLSFEGQRPGQVQATVRADGYCAQPLTEELAIEFFGAPAVRTSVIDRTDPVQVGQDTIYEVRVDNQGTAADLGIELVGQLSENMQFVSADGPSEVRADGNRLQFGAVQQLAPGESVVWMVRARATQPGDARLMVEMVSDANQQPIRSDEPTTVIGQQQDQSQQQGRDRDQGRDQPQ